MKKSLFLALAAASLSFTACTTNEQSAEDRVVQDNTDGTAEGAQPAVSPDSQQIGGGDGPASIEGTDKTTTNNGSSIYGGPTSRSTTPAGSTSTTGRTQTTTSASSTAGTTTAGTTSSATTGNTTGQ